jgi:hypothetical protein
VEVVQKLKFLNNSIKVIIKEKYMTFLDFAEKVISKENRVLTQNEIWEIGIKKGLDKDLNTKGLTPWQTLGSAIRKDIRDNQNTRFIKVDDIPFKYYLRSMPPINNVQTNNKIQKKIKDNNKFLEKELHKFLTYFVYERDKIYTKTINAQKSVKWINSIWRHPDIVGVSFPNWEKDIFELAGDIESHGIKFYSYELKRELTPHNLREHFFEAVSNSSWANEGYLVAAEISEDEEFLEEVKRLNSAFGIGLIKLSMDDPSLNTVVYQAKYNANIDIESINVLSKINKEFKEFIMDVKSDFSGNRRVNGKYDKILNVENIYKKQ